MKVLVVGGAGFIGSHLVDRLVSEGFNVAILDDFSTGTIENIQHMIGKVDITYGSIANVDFYSRFGRVDVVFNEASLPMLESFRNPHRDAKVNVYGLIKLLDYVKKVDAKLIHASTGSVYGNPVKLPIDEEHPKVPVSPYGVSKLCGEKYCEFYHRMFKTRVVILRYFNVYGPRQIVSEGMGVIPIFTKQAMQNQPITIHWTGKQTRDFTYVSDVVDANIKALENDEVVGHAINIGSGKEISILELCEKILRIANSRSEVIHKERKAGDVDRVVADITKAKKLLGWEPKISMDEGLRKYFQWAKLKISKRAE